MAHALDELIADGVAGRRVLVRSDLNVPLDGSTVTDDGRVRASLPVLKKLADAGARVIVMAHLGRPKGQVDPKYSIAPAARKLAELADFPAVPEARWRYVYAQGLGMVEFLTETKGKDAPLALARAFAEAGNADRAARALSFPSFADLESQARSWLAAR